MALVITGCIVQWPSVY